MIVTINALIFLVSLSPIWILITLVKGFGIFLLYLAKSALIIFAGAYGVITSFKSFNFYEFINQLLISIMQMVLKPLSTWDDIFPMFWDFARWEHPVLAFLIWFFGYFIAMFNK